MEIALVLSIAMNPIWWTLGIGADVAFGSLTFLVSLALVPFFLAYLMVWHTKNYAKDARVPEPTVS